MASSNTENWVELYAQYGSKMLLFARQYTHSHADAEDIVQDAFTRFWKRRHKFKKNPASCLFGCVRWSALDWLRKNRRRERREDHAATYESLVNGADYFERTIENEEMADTTQRAIESLPEAQREVVVLKIWGELTFAEIGHALSVSPNTAASRYRYGLAALKQKLKGIEKWSVKIEN